MCVCVCVCVRVCCVCVCLFVYIRVTTCLKVYFHFHSSCFLLNQNISNIYDMECEVIIENIENLKHIDSFFGYTFNIFSSVKSNILSISQPIKLSSAYLTGEKFVGEKFRR